MKILFTVFLIVTMFASASAITINVAQGGAMSYEAFDAPCFVTLNATLLINNETALNDTLSHSLLASTGVGQAWFFGPKEHLYAIPFNISQTYYMLTLTREQTNALPEGQYNVYLQFSGKDERFGIQHLDGALISPDRNGPTIVGFDGLTSRVAETVFMQARKDFPSDDSYSEITVNIQRPSLMVTNNYELGNGDLYVGGITNLNKGEVLSGTIDPDVYIHPEYHNMMTSTTRVSGIEYDHREWFLIFPQNLANQLTAGHHDIVITLPGGVKYTVPFNRAIVTISPTPTPEIRNVYSVEGTWLGYYVNTTAPNETRTPQPTVAPTPDYATLLVSTRNNRTIENHGTVYIGERNLDVTGAIGWPDPRTGNYIIQYCDIDNYKDYLMTLNIPNPHHFDIDPSIFQKDTGAWCQYSAIESGKARQPVAFIVKYAPLINMTSSGGNATTESANTNITATPTPVYNNYTPNPTIPPETTAATEIPTQDPNVVNVPLPWWIAGVAAIGVGLWKKK